MKKLIVACLFILPISMTWMGCNQKDEKFISEGSIEYTASVVDVNNPLASMAPSKMLIKFKNNKTCVEINAGMGLFNTSYISNPETKTLVQVVKLLNKKFWTMENENELKKEIADYKIKITPTEETKVIAGYKCKKAKVSYLDEDSTSTFDIYYTKDINIQNFNFANPFAPIDGVLLQYQVKRFGIEMKFVATKITKEPVDDATFQVPDDYKKISMKEMNALFGSLE